MLHHVRPEISQRQRRPLPPRAGTVNPLRMGFNYGPCAVCCARCAVFFAEQPTKWITVSNQSAGNQRFYNYVHIYMHMCALCSYTRHLCTCWYAAIHVNQPSGTSQAAAIANRTQGVNWLSDQNCTNR